MTETMRYTQVSGKEIDRIIGIMEEHLVGEDKQVVMMACLASAIIIQIPHITQEQLVNGVRACSEWVALLKSSIDNPVPAERMN